MSFKENRNRIRKLTLIFISVFLFFNTSFTIFADEEVYYSPNDEVGSQTYIAFTIDSKTIGISRSGIDIEDASINEEGKLKVTSHFYFEVETVENGFYLKREDRPSTSQYLDISEGSLVLSEDKPGKVFIYEEITDTLNDENEQPLEVSKGHVMAYKDDSETVYLILNEGNFAVTSERPSTGNAQIYSSNEKPSRSPGPGPGPVVDEKAPVITRQMDVLSYVMEGSGYSAPKVSITAKASDESTSLFFQWYVNGEKYGETIEIPIDENKQASSEITIDSLVDKEYGVYPIYCEVYVLEGEEKHKVDSYTNNFVITRGFETNSLMTFSDLHEKWDNIGTALDDLMKENEGQLPSLVVATGDYNNSHVAGYNEEYIERCIDTMINRIKLQLGDIDTVWVSGNHDNGYATGYTNANKEADLGMVDKDYYDLDNSISGTGIIFDTRSDSYQNNADSSNSIEDGLIVIGVNFEDIGSQGAYDQSTNGQPDSSKLAYGDENSTGTVYEHLKTALESIASNYNGELVLVSTHAGLHAVGVDEDSKSAGVKREWNGDDSYSIRQSDQIVELLNRYVQDLNMDLLFMFGHDHTRGETEFVKLKDDTITATVEPKTRKGGEGETRDIVLEFNYASAGYITDSLNGHKHYSYLTWNKETINRELKTVSEEGKVNDLSFVVSRIYKEEKKEEEKETEPEKKADEGVIRYYQPPMTGVIICQ